MGVMERMSEYLAALERFESKAVDFEFGTVFKREGDMLVRVENADAIVGYTEAGVVADAVNGYVSSEDERWALRDNGYGDWEPVSGFSGQHGYSGPSMHPSEQFSGNMAAAVWQDAEPGDYFVIIYLESRDVDGDGEVLDPDGDRDGYGWMLLKRTIETDGEG